MINILLTCINYNSYKELNIFLESVEHAYHAMKKMSLLVCIADNSSNKEIVNLDKYSFDCQYFPFDNVGYFGGATGVFDRLPNMHKYDYIIISNVDLEVDQDFFKNLPCGLDETIAWISPSILSSYENRDKGLGLSQRPSKLKLKLLTIMFKYPWMLYLIENTIYKRKALVQKMYEQEKMIYAGHGSFIILTSHFFKAYSNLHYPMFLFGEELFLGELIRQKGLKVIYNPILKIYDSEHVSTSQMPSKFSCKCQHDSISYILRTFYS